MHSYSLERRKHTQHLIDIATGHGDLICELNPERANELVSAGEPRQGKEGREERVELTHPTTRLCQHTAMRKRYLAGGEKEEPFLESVLHHNGCLLPDRGGGHIFLNRLILPAATHADQTPALFDNVVSTTKGWRVFQLLQRDEEVVQNGFDRTLGSLSFLEASVVSISARQDYQGEYHCFLGQENRVALIRPDQYVFGFFKDLSDLDAHASTIRERVCAM